MSRLAGVSLLILLSVSLISCGGAGSYGNSTITTAPESVPVTMSVQDTPPAGTTVLSFEIQITSANLLPSDTTKAAIPLLTQPNDVELEHLQSEPALVGSLSVPGGVYRGVTVTFTNPRMTIFNSTASPITVGTTVCAAKAACRLTPGLTAGTTTVTTAPFPITLTASSPLGLLLHFDVNSSVSSDLLTITPAIDLKQLLPRTGGVIHEQHLVGTITSVSSPNFTLQTGLGAPTAVGSTLPPVFLIKTDSNTKYSFTDDLHFTCTAINFTCLQMGQVVRVTANVLTDGTLLATQVSLFEQLNQPAFEGTVTSVNTTTNQFTMALLDGQFSSAAVSSSNPVVGVQVTVNVTPSTVYEMDSDGFLVPAGFSFKGIADMVVGQTVEIQPSAVSVGPVANTLSLTTLRVRLDETQVTAKILSIDSATGFTLGTLPPLFSASSSMKVQTIVNPPPTQFQNIVGVSGLAVGDTVSVGGLLFNTVTTPTIVAEKVLKRIPCLVTASGTTTTLPCVL